MYHTFSFRLRTIFPLLRILVFTDVQIEIFLTHSDTTSSIHIRIVKITIRYISTRTCYTQDSSRRSSVYALDVGL